ncbi:MAG: diguanylate cyclase [Elusimicrobia bacterium HGW-Elusimicrobia-1]|jgi:peptide/nickel transport system permease protein|nr:MAG: diguanylate cyclase [Elusimicrobia bacterium HGW-Elusimicrobia-1]
MKKYFLRRIINSAPVLLGITILTFFVMQAAPGKPTDLVEFSAKVSAESRQRLIKLYELDRPLHIRYIKWLGRMARLDFGNSFRDDRPAINKIAERLPATLLLNLLSLSVIFAAGIGLGVLCAVRHKTFMDNLITTVVFVGYSLPAFWLALMAIIFFGIHLGILPISGLRSLNYEFLPWWGKIFDVTKHLVLPVAITSFTGVAGLTRYAKSGMLDALKSDYTRFARAKGAPMREVVFGHALKNALLPVITIMGLSLPGIIGGGFIFETIFSYPGMGRLGYEAIMSRDYPVVMAISVIVAILTLAGNIIADAAYAFADPRIRYSDGNGRGRND